MEGKGPPGRRQDTSKVTGWREAMCTSESAAPSHGSLLGPELKGQSSVASFSRSSSAGLTRGARDSW